MSDATEPDLVAAVDGATDWTGDERMSDDLHERAALLEGLVRADHHDRDLDDHDVIERLDLHVESLFPGATYSYMYGDGYGYVASVWWLLDGAILHVSYDPNHDSVTCWVEA